MDNQSNLYERTKEAAIAYFELKEQYEKEISNAFNEYRKRCLIAFVETYYEFENQYPLFVDIYLKIPPQIVINNFGATYSIQELKSNFDKLKQGNLQPRFRWPALIECFMQTHIHSEEFVTVEHSHNALVTIDYERYNTEYTFSLDKVNILDPIVLEKEVKKFKQDTINYFNTTYNSYLQRRKQHIDYLQSNLTQ